MLTKHSLTRLDGVFISTNLWNATTAELGWYFFTSRTCSDGDRIVNSDVEYIHFIGRDGNAGGSTNSVINFLWNRLVFTSIGINETHADIHASWSSTTYIELFLSHPIGIDLNACPVDIDNRLHIGVKSAETSGNSHFLPGHQISRTCSNQWLEFVHDQLHCTHLVDTKCCCQVFWIFDIVLKFAEDGQGRNGWRHVKIIVDPVLYLVSGWNIACSRFGDFKAQWKLWPYLCCHLWINSHQFFLEVFQWLVQRLTISFRIKIPGWCVNIVFPERTIGRIQVRLLFQGLFVFFQNAIGFVCNSFYLVGFGFPNSSFFGRFGVLEHFCKTAVNTTCRCGQNIVRLPQAVVHHLKCIKDFGRHIQCQQCRQHQIHDVDHFLPRFFR